LGFEATVYHYETVNGVLNEKKESPLPLLEKGGELPKASSR
jgi:hypothetical protein